MIDVDVGGKLSNDLINNVQFVVNTSHKFIVFYPNVKTEKVAPSLIAKIYFPNKHSVETPVR